MTYREHPRLDDAPDNTDAFEEHAKNGCACDPCMGMFEPDEEGEC